MKNLKWIIPLAVVVVLLMVALPAAADDPFGGPPSKTSGNGATTWGAVYVGGTWDNKRSVTDGFYTNPNTFSLSTGVVSSSEYDKYVTNWSAKTTIPALSTRWFKLDTVKSRDVEIYVDDVPKWGAAYRYFDNRGCLAHGQSKVPTDGNGDCDRSDNLQRLGIDTSNMGKYFLAVDDRYDFVPGNSMFQNGFAARIYPPESINSVDYFWPAPNNSLLTTRTGTRPRVADTQGSYGGYGRGAASLITTSTYGSWNNTYSWLEPADQVKMGDGNTHLLGGKFHWDGWVYVRVFNNMYWDNDAQVGTRYTPNGKYFFPCDNCPYPFNP
jgi:hypothetical protein